MSDIVGKDVFKLVAQENRTAAETSGLYERLSSGLRINKPSDDIGGFQLATKLTSAQSLYTVATRNVNDEISRLTIAYSALGSLSDIVSQQEDLATAAASSAYTSDQRAAFSEEANRLADDYNRIVSTTEYNGQEVLDSSQTNTVQAGINGSSSSRIGYAIGSQLSYAVGDGTYSTEMPALDLTTQDAASDALTTIESFAERVDNEQGNVDAQLRRLATSKGLDETFADSLALAASKIRDVDVAEDTARLLKINIVNQNFTALEAQANLNSTSVLNLLGGRGSLYNK